jgi:hypothetical protein
VIWEIFFLPSSQNPKTRNVNRPVSEGKLVLSALLSYTGTDSISISAPDKNYFAALRESKQACDVGVRREKRFHLNPYRQSQKIILIYPAMICTSSFQPAYTANRGDQHSNQYSNRDVTKITLKLSMQLFSAGTEVTTIVFWQQKPQTPTIWNSTTYSGAKRAISVPT